MIGIARWCRDCRGSIAVLFALTTPVLLMALGLGIEISRWSVTNVQLQSIADAAALAGAFDYEHQSTPVARTAANAAAYLAQINGVLGTATPTWTAGTKLLTDNQIVVQIIAGPKISSDTAVQVTVSRSVQLYLAGIFTSATSQTITATAIAELMAVSGGGPQACVIALQGDANGITTSQDISITNGGTISTNGCGLRSDGDITLSGGATVDGNVVAAGTVSVTNGATVPSPYTTTSNAGQIPDPLASNTAVQNALTAAASATGTSTTNCNSGNGGVACTIAPGNYTNISITGNGDTLTLQPGLYTVNGPVNFSGGTVNFQTGGVTIVSSGAVSITNGVAINNFLAATPGSAGATAGAIPGILLATSATGSSAVSIAGGSNFAFSGMIYAPDGTLSMSNGVSTTSPGCSEIVASDVTMLGGAGFASSTCMTTYGSNFPPTPINLTTTAVLVQ